MHQSRRILREGLIAGLIGATSVAAWFLVVDAIGGRPFYTPAVLGSAATIGLRDASEVVIGFQPVAAYTTFHFLAFFAVGLVAALLAAEAERSLHVLWLVVEFFVVFQIGFYAAVGLIFSPLLAELAWITVAVGNLIAAVGMGYYLWRVRPGIGEQLAGTAPADGGEG